MIRKFILCMTVGLVFSGGSLSYPDVVRIEGGSLHVQGIALDKERHCMYASFTSAFYKTDMEGNVIGSITKVNGHLGDIVFDSLSRKVYASLEMKGDAIGRGIARSLGAEAYDKANSCFYIAEIAVDRIDGLDTPFDEAVKLYPVDEAVKDYLAKVRAGDETLEHRYGCSGIDGITLAPPFGSQSKELSCLYVAYGVYGDTLRCDNDYNILLCYDRDNLEKPTHKYFVYTGNTTYGVQNLAYDSFTGRMWLAVYKGRKSAFPGHSLFAIDVSQTPYDAELKGVPYHQGVAEQLDVCGAWNFRWGSTGLCPLGDGRYYISHNSKTDRYHVCDAVMYLYGDGNTPFFPCAR